MLVDAAVESAHNSQLGFLFSRVEGKLAELRKTAAPRTVSCVDGDFVMLIFDAFLFNKRESFNFQID